MTKGQDCWSPRTSFAQNSTQMCDAVKRSLRKQSSHTAKPVGPHPSTASNLPARYRKTRLHFRNLIRTETGEKKRSRGRGAMGRLATGPRSCPGGLVPRPTTKATELLRCVPNAPSWPQEPGSPGCPRCAEPTCRLPGNAGTHKGRGAKVQKPKALGARGPGGAEGRARAGCVRSGGRRCHITASAAAPSPSLVPGMRRTPARLPGPVMPAAEAEPTRRSRPSAPPRLAPRSPRPEPHARPSVSPAAVWDAQAPARAPAPRCNARADTWLRLWGQVRTRCTGEAGAATATRHTA